MATCKIHNVKFYKLDPQGINCMALEKTQKKIAISRSNATIQIWNISHTPYIERTITHKSEDSIEALCWFEDRLFSVGLGGSLIEYDLQALTQKYAIPITGGAGWCMDIHRNQIVIGTEQGYLNLYEITADGVEYVKILDKQEGRILCLKFDHTGQYIASGSVDTVRVWNVASGHAINKMNLSRSTNKTETLVWCLLVTENFTIVSGDSRGYITFWDGESGSQIESYQSHTAAVLSLCITDDFKTIYCAGVDPLIMSYERISMKGKSESWIRSTHRRIHEHDVRNLVFCDGRLYSGGIDGYLACSYYPPKTLVKYPPLLQNPSISTANEAKYILLQYSSAIEVWSLGEEADEKSANGPLKLVKHPKKLLEVQTKGGEGVTCSDISNNGQLLFYSTPTKFRLFHLNYNDDNVELIQIDNLPKECIPCLQAQFTYDNKYLIVALRSGRIIILEIGNEIFISQIIDAQEYLKDATTFLQVSADGKYLVAADPKSNIVVWNFQHKKWKHYINLPKYECAPTSLGIHPNTNDLVVAYADHKLIEYSLEMRKFTKFSRGLNENIPRLNRSFPIINVTFDPRADHIILLHDDTNICVVEKKKELTKPNAKVPKLNSSTAGITANISNYAFHTVKRNKHLVYLGWIGDGEVVSVEVNPLNLLEKLPPCFPRKKFGKK